MADVTSQNRGRGLGAWGPYRSFDNIIEIKIKVGSAFEGSSPGRVMVFGTRTPASLQLDYKYNSF